MPYELPSEPLAATARAVVDRMKRATGAATDAELAAFLGVTKGAVPNWRKHGVPAKHLQTTAEKGRVTVEWLRSGVGWSPGSVVDYLRGHEVAPVDPGLLAVALERAAQEWAAVKAGQELQVSYLAERAAVLYDYYRLRSRGSEEERKAMVNGMLIAIQPHLRWRSTLPADVEKVDGPAKVDG